MIRNTKTFPKSRIFVIDIFPYFQEALKLATDFSKKYNTPLQSADGLRVILGYCLKTIKNNCTNINSPYPVVLCLSNKKLNKKLDAFTNMYFNKITKLLPHPYCGKYDLSSPDLELAAEQTLNKTNNKIQNFKSIKERLGLKV